MKLTADMHIGLNIGADSISNYRDFGPVDFVAMQKIDVESLFARTSEQDENPTQ